MTSVTISAGNVTLDTTGLFISPVSASGGGAYANANAVRWTTDTTYRTAIWRSDDSGAAAYRKWNFDQVQQGSGGVNDTSTNFLAKTTMVAGSGSGTGQLKVRGQVNAVSEAQLFALSNDGTNARAATLYLGTLAGGPGQREIALGFATSESAMTGTSTAAPTLDQGIYINLGGTQLYDTAVRLGTDTHTLTQSNAVVSGSSNSEGFGVSGGTQSLVNMNFYADAGTNGQRRATIQAQRACTSNRGGQMLFYSKPDATAGTDVALAGMIDCNQGLVWGAPTGGSKGAGTINAQTVYDDNVVLTDSIFDLHYDGYTALPNPGRLYTMAEVQVVTATEHRLPWMPTKTTFEKERSLGGMITRLWQGQEQQQLYFFDLEARITALETELARFRAGGKQ